MATYLVMGLPFIAAVLALDLLILKTKVITNKRFWIVLALMLIMTAIFDQVLTGLPIVTYNEAKMLGLKIGYAPIEDFMYSFAAVVGLGSLSTYYEQRKS